MKSRYKLSKNFSLHGKNHEICGRTISEHLLKTIFLMFETETVGPCLVRNLKYGGHGPPGPHSGYAPESSSGFNSCKINQLAISYTNIRRYFCCYKPPHFSKQSLNTSTCKLNSSKGSFI